MEEERRRKVQAGKEKFDQLMKKKNSQVSESVRRKKLQKRTAAQDTAEISNVSLSHIADNLVEKNGTAELLTNLTERSIDSNMDSSVFDQNQSRLQLTETCSKCSENKIADDDKIVTISETELKLKLEGYSRKFQEFQNALQHRDKIISELSASLQTTIENRDQLQSEATDQAELLAMEIDKLKHQLHEATELLRNQKGRNNVSAQELLEAKNQVITFQMSHQQKDKIIERITNQLHEEMTNWKTTKSNLELQIQELQHEALQYKQQRDEIFASKNKLENQLRQQADEMSKLRQFFTIKAKQRDEEYESLKQELNDSKKLTDELQMELKAKLDSLTKEKGVEENEKINLKHELEALKKQYQVLLNTLDEQQIKRDTFKGVDTEMISCEKESKMKGFEENLIGRCVIAGDVSLNLDQVMKEILQLKTENERLKLKCDDNGSKENSLALPMECGDHASHLQTEMSLWKVKYDQVLKEKMDLELKLKSQNHVEFKINRSPELKEELQIRVKLLENQLQNESQFRLKCEAMEKEKNKLNETLMNQINTSEKLKLDFELKLCELESRYNSLLRSKEELENDFVTNGHRPVFSDAYLAAMKKERSDISDMEFLVQHLATTENNLSIMKLRLHEAEEIKSSLEAKICHLISCCEKHEFQQTQVKNELSSVQHELQLSWEQQEKIMNELAEIKKDSLKKDGEKLSENKLMEDEQPMMEDEDVNERVNLICDAPVNPEIQSLKNDLKEMEEKFAEENNMLKKCIEEERFRCRKLADLLQVNGVEVEGSICDGEWIDLNHKMKLVMDSNKELLDEKEVLLQQLAHQKEILDNVDGQDDLSPQLVSLSHQQNELIQRLQKQNENHIRFFDVLQEKDVLQEALRREKEALAMKIQEKDNLQSKLIHQRVELEHLRFEKRHLEELLMHKDQLEQELQKQRRSLEDDLADLEQHLKDREDAIQREKRQLQMEMQRKDLVLRKWQTDLKEKQVEYECLHSTLQAKHEDQACRMQIHLQEASLRRIEQMRAEIDSHHSAALERLKMDLTNQFAIREGRLVECHLAEVSKLQQEQVKLLQENVQIPADVSGGNSRLLEELSKIISQCEKDFEINIDTNEQQLSDDINEIIHKLTRRQLGLIYNQIKAQVSKGLNEISVIHEAQIKALQTQAQLSMVSRVAEEREKLSKEFKNRMNKTTVEYEEQLKFLKEDHEFHLASLFGEEKLTSKGIMNQLQVHVDKEFRQQIQNLTQVWEKEYLERLANLRKEVEEKFKEATTGLSGEEKMRDDNGKRNEELFSQVETILEEKDELINKVTELRENVEKAQVTEIRVLKEHLQSEFSCMVEVQTEMKRDLESNESPVLVELKKIKEEYEKLQEKYEEITKEEIEIEEETVPSEANREKIVTNKTTELPGASQVSIEKSYDEIKEESNKRKVEESTLEEELKKLQAKLEEKHIKEMEELRIYFEKRCEDMEMKYVDEVSRVKASQSAEENDGEFVLRERENRLPTLTHFCDTSHVLESNFMDLEEHYKAEFDQKLVEYREQLEEVRKQLEKKHKEEIVDLRKEMDERVKEETDVVRKEMEEKYVKEIEDVVRKYQQENEVLKSKYADDLAREITNVRVECTSEFASEIEVERKKMAEEIKAQHEVEMSNLQRELELRFDKKLEIMQMRFDAEKADEINNAVKELKNNLKKERDQLLERDTCQEIVNESTGKKKVKEEQLKAEYEKQLELVTNSCKAKCDNLEKELANILNEKEEINKKVDLLEEKTRIERKEFEERELTLVETHKVALSACGKEKQLAVETLREQFQEEIRELDVKYEEKIKEIESKWKNQVEESKKENEKLKDQHGKELERLKVEYEKELNEEKIKWQDELTADHIVKFEAVTQELDSCHQSELDEMRENIRKEFEEEMEQLQHNLTMKEKEYRLLIQELKENHEKDSEELKQEQKILLAAEVKRVRQEMENLCEEKVQAIVLDTDAIKAELEDVHRKEIIELQEKLAKRHQEEMESEVKRVICDMEKLQESHRKKIIEEHGKKLEAVKEELVENFKNQLQMFSEECDTQKEAEIKALKSHFEEELARVSSSAANEKTWQLEELKVPEEEEGKEEVYHESDQVEEVSEELMKNRRDREKQETENLIALLQQQLGKLTEERDELSRDNEHLKQLLTNIVHSYAKVEMIVNRHLTAIANTDISEQSSPVKSDGKDSARLNLLDSSGLSLLSEDISELVVPIEIDLNNDEVLNAIGGNLELAVTRLLHLLTVTVQQCHESKIAQIDLVNTAAAHGEEAATLEAQLAEEIQNKEQLTKEIHKAIDLVENYKIEKERLEEDIKREEEAKQDLMSQLEQAQIRIHEMQEQMDEEKNHFDHQRSLISEGLTSEEQVSDVKNDDSTESNLTGGDQGILLENTQLHTKHSNLQRQSEKDRHQLRKRIHELELVLEEQATQSEHQLELKRQEIEDLHQQIDALDKQLRADKKFFDAQTLEYEQEREEFQREVNRLQSCIREKNRHLETEERLSNELEALAEQLETKTQAEEDSIQKKNFVEAEFQRLQDEMKDRNEIIKNLEVQLEERQRTEQELTEQIKNLQNALDQTSQTHEELVSEIEVLRSASTSEELSMHVQFLEDQLESRSRDLDSFRNSQSFMQELRGQIRNLEEKVDRRTRDLEALQLSASSVSSPSSEDLSLKDQLEAIRSMQADDAARSASPYYFDDVKRLEDKLDAHSRAEEAAIKKTRDLELSLKKHKQMEEELLQDKEALQQQVNSQLLQISALQARIEEWRHNIDNSDALEKIARLQERVERDREILELKDKDMEDLRDQLEQNRSELISRENEICRLTRGIGDGIYQEKNWKQLNAENISLKEELKDLQEQFNSMSIPAFAQTLLDEKNQEIDHLNMQLEEMQLNLEKFQSNQAGDALMSGSEHIKITTPTEPTISSLEKALNERDEKLKRMEELMKAGQEEIISFQRVLSEKEELSANLKQKDSDIKRANELAEHRKREVDSLRGVLKEKQALLEQVETLQEEVASLTEFQTKLQEDYDTVQSMLEDTQKDLINVQQQMMARDEARLVEQRKFEEDIAELRSAVSTKDDEISNLKDRLDLSAKNGAMKQDELQREITRIRGELELSRNQIESSKKLVNKEVGDESSHLVQEETSPTESKREITVEQEREEKINTLQQEKVELESKLKELMRNENEMRTTLSSTQVELDTLRNSKETSTELKKLQLVTEEMKKQMQEHKEEFNKTSEELQRAKNYQTSLEMELANIPKLKKKLKENEDIAIAQREEVTKWKESFSKIKSDNERLKESEKNLLREQQKRQEEFITAANKYSTCLAEKDKLIKKLESQMKQSAEDEKSSKDEGQSCINVLENQLKELKESLEKSKEERNKLEAKDIMQQSEIERLRDEIEQFEESMDTLQNLLDMEKEGKRKLEEEHKKREESLIAQYKLKLDSLQQLTAVESSAVNIPEEMSRITTLEPELNGFEDTQLPVEMQSLIRKVHKEGVQVLSLSELLYLKTLNQKSSTQPTTEEWKPETWTLHHAWENEKQQLLAEIVALKDLLTQATEATASLRTTGQATADLSNLLLQAVSTVFQKERETIVAELRTHILASRATTPNDIERIEQRIKEMENNQQLVLTRVKRLFEEPESLIQQDIHSILNKERLKHLKEREQLLKQITKLENDMALRERHFRKQTELNEYHLKQEEMLTEDLRHTLQMEKKRTLDLSSQLSHEKGLNADLDTTLTLTRSELLKAQTSNDRDKREIQSLTFNLDCVLAACESEKFRNQALLQALEAEQANFAQLQEAMEAEKRRCKSSNERHQQIIQELQRSLEISKENQLKAITALEHERLNHANTCQELERSQNKRIRTATTEISQNELGRSLDLTAALERERSRVSSLNTSLTQERGTAIEDLERERARCLQIQKKLDTVQEQNFEMRRDLQREKERSSQLDTECLQLRTQYSQYRELESQRQSEWEIKRQLEKERQRETELTHEQDRHKQRELELEIQKNLQRIQILEKQLEQKREIENQLSKDLQEEREKNNPLLLGVEALTNYHSSGLLSSNIHDSHYVETAKQQFQCLIFKCQQELEPIIKQLGMGDSIIQNIASILKNLVNDINKIKIALTPESASGEDMRLQQFLEQVLHQNAELIGFVIQLCEDKMELRHTQLKLEEELVQLRHKQMTAEQNSRRSLGTSEDTLSMERMAWAQERAALQLTQHKLESEVIQLKCSLQMHGWNTSRESLSTHSAPTKGDEKFRRMQLKYLRAESFRKALIYQKKYLLILLGGFQETEAATLAIISQIGVPGTTLFNASSILPSRVTAIRRFRSAARVVIAIKRMKFLVRRWRKQIRTTPSENQDTHYNTRTHVSTDLSENHFALLGSRPASITSPDEHHFRFHRIGTTPPVRDLRHSERSTSSAKKSLTASIAVSSGDTNDRNILQYVKSDKSLERYLERLETIQQDLGISTSSDFPLLLPESDTEQS